MMQPDSGTPAVLEARALRRSFRQGDVTLEVLRGADMRVLAAERIAIVGASGSGKTTLLQIIGGLDRPSGGQVLVDGRDIHGLDEAERSALRNRTLGFVYQFHHLLPEFSALENVAMPLLVRRCTVSEARQRAAAILGRVGLGERLDHRPGQLSGGERQRAALGRAIVRQPACFLFDEPLSSLDPHLRAEMRLEIRRLHGQLATTSLYVTHDQEEALTLGHRVAVIERGRVQQVGRPLDVYRHPANRFVAAFLGRPPMNFLDGVVLPSAGTLWLQRTPHAPREVVRWSGPDDACGAEREDVRHAERDEYEGAGDDLRIALPAWAAAGLADRRGQPLTVGIRPEDLLASPDESRPTVSLTAVVQQVERLGDRTHVYLDAGGQRLVASWSARSAAEAGTTVQVHLDLNRLHFFALDDPAAGRWGENICLASEPDL
jgi:ABC-type sugar transport system ATPase subunit